MRAMRLTHAESIAMKPLVEEQIERPHAGRGEIILQVKACGLCHTDLHTVEGEIKPPALPITPGHQIVGSVVEIGEGVTGWSIGDRAGVPWLYQACSECEFCLRGEENLCPNAKFTGFHVDGGYAEFARARADYALHIPESLSDELAAPLLCAGIIGYRSLHKADLKPGERLGLVGFGASAHLAIQVARHWGCETYVFTRSESHRRLALDLGAAWAGTIDQQAPQDLDRAILFAPVGDLVPAALAKIRPGGTLAINAIYLSPIPEMRYELIYGERTLRSVTNATYQDGVEFLKLAAEIPIKAKVQVYPLERANEALDDLKASRIDGAGVLKP